MKKAFTTILMAALCMSCYAQEPADTNLPPQALSIITQMDKEISAAQQKAVKALEKVLADIVKTGNLESANRVKARIDELKSDLPDSTNSQKRPWYACKWVQVGHPDKILTLNKDGTASFSDGNTGEWSFNNGILTIKWKNGGGWPVKIEIGKKGEKSYTAGDTQFKPL
jgi:hypothetical protein